MNLNFELLKDCQLEENKLLGDFAKYCNQPELTIYDAIKDGKTIGYVIKINGEIKRFVQSYESVINIIC